MKFPHFIRSQKRLPDSGLCDNHMQWDFWTSNPESAHQVTYVMGVRGLPRTWRHMNGYGSCVRVLEEHRPGRGRADRGEGACRGRGGAGGGNGRELTARKQKPRKGWNLCGACI